MKSEKQGRATLSFPEYWWWKSQQIKNTKFLTMILEMLLFKDCARYIFASLFCMSKREYLQNKEKSFLFHFESSCFEMINF